MVLCNVLHIRIYISAPHATAPSVYSHVVTLRAKPISAGGPRVPYDPCCKCLTTIRLGPQVLIGVYGMLRHKRHRRNNKGT